MGAVADRRPLCVRDLRRGSLRACVQQGQGLALGIDHRPDPVPAPRTTTVAELAAIPVDAGYTACITHFGTTGINHGWQDWQEGTVKGHLVDLCEVLG